MTRQAVQWLGEHNAGMTRRFVYSLVLATASAGVLVGAAQQTQTDQPPLTFRVEAHDEKEPIGEGSHERVVVNVARFDQGVQKKLRRA